jgi:dTDP-4-dehydrorhamnose reductase
MIYVLGYSGQIGKELRALGAGPIICGQKRCSADLRPGDVVINAAAVTDANKARLRPEASWDANADLVKRISCFTRDAGARLIHLSTDYVFGGEHGSYHEDDSFNPAEDVYAMSKLAGEMAFQIFAPKNSSLVRTQWVFSTHRKAWFDSEKIWDQFGGLTYAADIAAFLMKLASIGQPPKVLHYVTQQGISRPVAARLSGNTWAEVVDVPEDKPKNCNLRVSDFCVQIHTPKPIQECLNEYRKTFPAIHPSVSRHQGLASPRPAPTEIRELAPVQYRPHGFELA